MEMWTPAELGWWFATALSSYGGFGSLPKWLGEMIPNAFHDRNEMLVWLFLGAHG